MRDIHSSCMISGVLFCVDNVAFSYCVVMRQPAASPLDTSRWGGLPELLTFAHMHKVTVVVHDSSNKYVLAPFEQHDDSLPRVHLSWRGGCHYNYFQEVRG